MSATHDLKCWPEYFRAIVDEKKRHEIRRNDRNFAVGDTCRLREWNPETGEYTGHFADIKISYLTGPFPPLDEVGHVAFSFRLLSYSA